MKKNFLVIFFFLNILFLSGTSISVENNIYKKIDL